MNETTDVDDDTIARHGRWDFRPMPGGRTGWPGGARLAVYLALGLEDYRFGQGQTEDLIPGVPAPDLVNASWRDYGNRVGAYRLLDRFDELGVPPTVLLNTALYDSAPELLARARRSGAEIVGHGISNSDSLAGMDEPTERAYLRAVAQRIAQEEGSAPTGWSSPWLTHTERTPELLVESGFRYILDLRPDDRPFWMTTSSGPLLVMPYALELNDSSSIIGRGVSAADFAEMIVDEFEELLVAAEDEPQVMSVVVHSFISGAPFRLRQLTRALRHLTSRGPAVWWTQPRHIHSALRSVGPRPPLVPHGQDR